MNSSQPPDLYGRTVPTIGSSSRPPDLYGPTIRSINGTSPPPDLYGQTIVSIVPGDVLCGRYVLEAMVGLGGMAQVWRARDRVLDDRLVAMKVLPAAANADRRSVERLKTEALRHIDLRHDHIVGLYDFAIDVDRGGLAFLVMEYIAGADGVNPGMTLADVLAEADGGRQSESSLRSWAQPIAAAIDYAHGKGVLHRDIKPQNILFDGGGRAALADFGIACELRATMTRVTGRSDSSGTLLYMSPEQLRGDLDRRNDVYAFAATVYEALSGRSVIDPAGDPYFQIQHVEPPAIAGVSAELNRAILCGLAKSKADRPASCGALLRVECQKGAAIGVPPASAPVRGPMAGSRPGQPTTAGQRERVAGDVLTLLLGKRGEREVEFRFRWIPPGSFMQGSLDDEEGRLSREGPQRRVTFGRGFWLLETPVTQGQWKAVMGRGNNPSWFKDRDDADRRPVENVSWDDCQSFLRDANDQDAMRQAQRRLRLPSESEWEYACRAGTTTPFHFGSTISTDQANYDGNFTYANGRKGVYRKETTPVGMFAPNAWGLRDMHANVWEWCEDVWHWDYAGAPTDGSAWLSVGVQSHRVLRGGSWRNRPGLLRSAFRDGDAPDGRDDYCGFRPALDSD